MPRKIDIEALCAEKGLRITEQRRVIARVLSEAEDHPDVERVHERSAAIDPGISIATVYRTVRLFEEAGILDRAHSTSNPSAAR
jgi:Fur family ferric uptake transcriptional regulator